MIIFKRNTRFVVLVVIIIAIMSSGCTRNQPSERTPIHLNPDMDQQPKYKPQSASQFFADSSAQRTPVAGTVARGELRSDNRYYKGIDSRDNFLEKMPVDITMQLLERGRERYDIYCSPCHSRIGDGKGIMIGRGYPPPPSFHEDRIIEFPDGHIFDVISHGIRNMPAYNNQIPVADRWAIVAYLRALQRSQKASMEDVPPEMRQKIREVK